MVRRGSFPTVRDGCDRDRELRQCGLHNEEKDIEGRARCTYISCMEDKDTSRMAHHLSDKQFDPSASALCPLVSSESDISSPRKKLEG